LFEEKTAGGKSRGALSQSRHALFGKFGAEGRFERQEGIEDRDLRTAILGMKNGQGPTGVLLR